ncbi:hypothetical protein CWE12_05810 [Aliidiomarina sedimenti]|uniref:Uncharacterized protein n=1 Tax=Aliidiomarina sedimenti TaxID=1933879 RepID=A0ABY0C0J5_9GAMM|nr:hypothetical protein CWE12_05810 [Aliidiomarina sedimenti]
MQENRLNTLYLLPIFVLILAPLDMVSQTVSILALALSGVIGSAYYLFIQKRRNTVKVVLISLASFLIWWPLAFLSVRATTLFFERLFA